MTNEEAVMSYSKLVGSIAKKFKRAGVDVDDLMQAGYLGLFKAAEEWQDGAGASFETMASARIRDAMRKEARDASRFGVSLDAPASSADESGVSLLESPSPRMMGIADSFTAPAQDELMERAETITQVRAAMNHVAEKDRELLNLWTECHKEAGELADDGTARRSSGAVPEMSRRLGVARKTIDDRCRAAMGRLGAEVFMARAEARNLAKAS